MDYTLTVYAVI